jgi:Flp pilus assembly pilin Flp
MRGPGVSAVPKRSFRRGIRTGTLDDQEPAPQQKGKRVYVIESRLWLLERPDGQVLAEYAVILGVITLAVAGVFTVLAGGVAEALSTVVTAF